MAASAGGGAGGATTGGSLVVVLEQARLETVKTKKVCGAKLVSRFYLYVTHMCQRPVVDVQGFELLNCDDHVGLHKKAGRNPAESRPDITHQLLLTLLDSPLNKAGKLQILIQTQDNVLIEVSPKTRIPRTFKRFAGLMGECCADAFPSTPRHSPRHSPSPHARSISDHSTHAQPSRLLMYHAVQLLHKMRVRAADGSETLLKVIKNPVTAHLPVGATVVGLEIGAKLVDPVDLPTLLPQNQPIVFVLGAMSHGDITADYITQTFSLSKYPLSAACAAAKLLNAFEHAWGVL